MVFSMIGYFFKVGAAMNRVLAPLIKIANLFNPIIIAVRLMSVLFTAVGWIFEKLGDAFSAVFGPIGDALDWIASGLDALFNPITIITDMFSYLGGVWDKFVGSITASDEFGALSEAASELGGVIKDIFDGIGSAIGILLSPFGVIKTVISWIYEKLGGEELGAGCFDLILWGIEKVTSAVQWVTGIFKELKESIFGSSFLHIGEGIAAILPWFDVLTGAVDALLSPIRMVGKVWNWIFGDDDDTAAAGGSKGASDPISSVLFGEGSKRNQGEYMQELVMLQTETVMLLAGILGKEDPNSERTADAMETLAQISGESDEVRQFRNSRTGFGEQATNWWVNG